MTTPVPSDRSATPSPASADRSVTGPSDPESAMSSSAAAPAGADGTTPSVAPTGIVPPPPTVDTADTADTADGTGAGEPGAAPATGADEPPARSSHRRAETPAARASRSVYLVPALLVVALVLLVVGLVTANSVWLAASLGASVLAALLLVVERLVQRRRTTSGAAGPTGTSGGDLDTDTGVVDLDAPTIDPDDPEAVWVVDGRPRYHARGCETLTSLPAEPISRTQALEDGFVACSLCEPGVSSRAQHGR